jgi:DNA-binding transcriptional regulator LsrR (DeoR family)
MLKSGKQYGLLHIDVGTSDQANIMVEEGLLHDYELKQCKIFYSECYMTQCYKC